MGTGEAAPAPVRSLGSGNCGLAQAHLRWVVLFLHPPHAAQPHAGTRVASLCYREHGRNWEN